MKNLKIQQIVSSLLTAASNGMEFWEINLTDDEDFARKISKHFRDQIKQN